MEQSETGSNAAAGNVVDVTDEGRPSVRPWRQDWWWVGLLLVVYFLVRVPGLTRLPIFCDESVNLRQGQLISRDPLGEAFASLADPKPPLHPWMLGLAERLCRDPLWGGRMVSVILGALGVLGMVGLARELERWGAGRRLALVAGLMLVFCPYVAFSNRMALADTLFLTSSIWAAYQSLRLARLLEEGVTFWAGVWRVALPLSLAMFGGMMSRQGVGYSLWAVPALAVFLAAGRPGADKADRSRARKRGLWWVAAAGVVAVPPWACTIMWHCWHDPIGKWSTIKERLVYHSDYVKPLTLPERVELIKGTLFRMFVPSAHGVRSWGDITASFSTQWPVTGWYWVYLTPPILALCLAGIVYLAARRRWRAFLLLGMWWGAVAAPFVIMGTRLYARHLLYAVAPFLVCAAWLVADALGAWTGRIKSRGSRAVGIAAVLAALLAMPGYRIYQQDVRPRQQAMTSDDAWQYLHSWACGYAAQKAVEFLRDRAKEGPIVVMTTYDWGTPGDAVWLYLDGKPNVKLYFTFRNVGKPLVRQDEKGQIMVWEGKWSTNMPPSKLVTIPPSTRLYFVDGVHQWLPPGPNPPMPLVVPPVRYISGDFVGRPDLYDGAIIYRVR